jgi:CBS domain-containing protein
MNHYVVTVTEADSVEKVVELMLHHDVNRIPVVRDGTPVGIVARHDLLRLMLHDRGIK